MTNTIDDLAAVALGPAQSASIKKHFLEVLADAISREPLLVDSALYARVTRAGGPDERYAGVRRTAMLVISRIVEHRPDLIDGILVDVLTHVSAKDEDMSNRRCAHSLLGRISDSLPVLSEAVHPKASSAGGSLRFTQNRSP